MEMDYSDVTLCLGFLILLHLVTVLHKEIHIIQTVHQAVLLILVDFKMLAVPRCKIGDRLVRQINFHLRLMILVYAFEKFLQKSLRNDYGKHKVIKLIILVDICEE